MATISARLTDGSKLDIKVEDIDCTILSLKELIAAVRKRGYSFSFPSPTTLYLTSCSLCPRVAPTPTTPCLPGSP